MKNLPSKTKNQQYCIYYIIPNNGTYESLCNSKESVKKEIKRLENLSFVIDKVSTI